MNTRDLLARRIQQLELENRRLKSELVMERELEMMKELSIPNKRVLAAFFIHKYNFSATVATQILNLDLATYIYKPHNYINTELAKDIFNLIEKKEIPNTARSYHKTLKEIGKTYSYKSINSMMKVTNLTNPLFIKFMRRRSTERIANMTIEEMKLQYKSFLLNQLL